MKRRVLFLLAGLAALVFISKRRKGVALSHHNHNKEIARRFTEEPWDNPDVINELVSADFIAYDPSMPEPIRGIQGAKDFVGMYKGSFPDAKVTADELIAERIRPTFWAFRRRASRRRSPASRSIASPTTGSSRNGRTGTRSGCSSSSASSSRPFPPEPGER